LAKAQAVVAKLHAMRLGKAAEVFRQSVPETLSYMSFPSEHWRSLRTNNPYRSRLNCSAISASYSRLVNLELIAICAVRLVLDRRHVLAAIVWVE
jgi:hypothetical protein